MEIIEERWDYNTSLIRALIFQCLFLILDYVIIYENNLTFFPEGQMKNFSRFHAAKREEGKSGKYLMGAIDVEDGLAR